jgi:hypothetical protein
LGSPPFDPASERSHLYKPEHRYRSNPILDVDKFDAVSSSIGVGEIHCVG